MAYSAAEGGGQLWTPEDDKVDTEVARITSQDSPLMQQAKTAGLATAQKRGLLNSSMAVGAAQDSVLKTAVPIASQNAGQTFQKNLSTQQFGQQSGLSKQEYEQNRGLQEQKFGFDSNLSKQNFEQSWKLNDQNYNLTYALNDQKFNQDKALSDQDFRQKSQLTQLDNSSKEKIASWNVAAHDKEKAMSALAAMEGNYSEVFRTIAANNQLPAEARNAYLEHIAKLRDSSLNLVKQMYGVDIDWATPVSPNVQV